MDRVLTEGAGGSASGVKFGSNSLWDSRIRFYGPEQNVGRRAGQWSSGEAVLVDQARRRWIGAGSVASRSRATRAGARAGDPIASELVSEGFDFTSGGPRVRVYRRQTRPSRSC